MWRRSSILALLLALAIPATGHAYTYTHEVLPGERLRDIAKRYHTTVRRIKRRNRLRSNRLRAGRKLRIITSVPSRSIRKVRYRVVKGDSLSKIAKRFKMKRWLLRRLNPRLGRGALRIGRRLWVVVEGPRPSAGVKGLYKLDQGSGYKVRNPRRSWGTFLAVMRIGEVLTAYGRAFPKAPPVVVWDLSRRGGGYFPPHSSHRRGRDVDIVYPKLKKYRKRVYLRARMMDPRRTWWLIKRFIKTGDVTVIFMNAPFQRRLYRYAKKIGEPRRFLRKVFQYPGRRRKTIIRHSRGHHTHFHVRFRRERKRKPNS